MRRASWPVTRALNCVHCARRTGEEHAPDCVIRRKTVVVRVTVEMVRAVPESWDGDSIEFAMNEGSWCSDNIVTELRQILDRAPPNTCTLCRATTAEFVREATEEDERLGRFSIDGPEGGAS